MNLRIACQNKETSIIASAPPKGEAWRMPARKEAGGQKSQNPEVHHNSSFSKPTPASLQVNVIGILCECQATDELLIYFHVRYVSGSSRNFCQCDHMARWEVSDSTVLTQGQKVVLSSGAQELRNTTFIEFLPIRRSKDLLAVTNRYLLMLPRGGMNWIKSSNVLGAGAKVTRRR